MKTVKRIIGDAGEKLATSYLISHKYKILERNFLVAGGEIDIIALETKKSRKFESINSKIPKEFLNEDVICFVEVKTRSSNNYGMPSEAVTHEKQKNIIHAANSYLNLKNIKNKQFRFDIIEVLNGEVVHIKNAF